MYCNVETESAFMIIIIQRFSLKCFQNLYINNISAMNLIF